MKCYDKTYYHSERDIGGGSREEIIKIYWEQGFLQDGADDCGAYHDTKWHH